MRGQPERSLRLVVVERELEAGAAVVVGSDFSGISPHQLLHKGQADARAPALSPPERLEDLIRAQNPAAGPQPQISFEHVVQQFYVSAMIQMGAGTQEGQRPKVDILGARTTIDLLGVLAEKTKGNLSEAEDKILQTVLFEVRMAFLELTSMITSQGMQPPQPPKKA